MCKALTVHGHKYVNAASLILPYQLTFSYLNSMNTHFSACMSALFRMCVQIVSSVKP